LLLVGLCCVGAVVWRTRRRESSPKQDAGKSFDSWACRSHSRLDRSRVRQTISWLGIVAAFIGPASVAAAQVTVLPPGATVAGQTNAEWTTHWWQWAFAQSSPNDAFTDATGANANIDQSGPVFFLAGTATGSATRTFTAPADQYILLPLVNVALSELELGPNTEAQLRLQVDGIVAAIDSLTAVIDGVPLANLFSYSEPSPLFSFTAAANNPFGLAAGPSGNAVGGGYYLMLAPLGLGTHTISYGGGASSLGFTTLANATITAVPEPGSLLLAAVGLAPVWWWARRRRASPV
jgi:hypothetical protein